MGDSTTLLIKSLRARIHSERSISRIARQRSHQLARRVIELEERLRLMIIQRNRAVKAAAKVLTILGTQAIGDSDLDSSYDTIRWQLEENDDTSKEDNTSKTSTLDRSEVDDGFTDFELDSCQQQKITRRSSLVFPVEYSQKPYRRKSCRKFKQKKTRLSTDRHEEMDRVLKQQAQLISENQEQENAQREWEEKYSANQIPTQVSHEILPHPVLLEDTSCELTLAAIVEDDCNQHHEKEAKLKAGDISTTKDTSMQSLSMLTQRFQDTKLVKSEATDAVILNGIVPKCTIASKSTSYTCLDGLSSPKYNHLDAHETETSSQEFTFPVHERADTKTNERHIRGLHYGNLKAQYETSSSINPGTSSSVYRTCKPPKLGSHDTENQTKRKPTQSPHSKVGGVLDTLQHAKVSLGQKLTDLPPPPSRSTPDVSSPTSYRLMAVKCSNASDAPTAPSRLSTLQSDSVLQASFSEPKFWGTGLSSAAIHRNKAYGVGGFRGSARNEDIGPRTHLGM